MDIEKTAEDIAAASAAIESDISRGGKKKAKRTEEALSVLQHGAYKQVPGGVIVRTEKKERMSKKERLKLRRAAGK